MNTLFGIDPNVANTIITAISTVVAGIIGGWIGARSTKSATERALNHNLTLQEEDRRAVLRGALLGIRAELEQLLMISQAEEIETDVNEAVVNERPLHVVYPIHLNYFIIYEANASLIGQITDDELRKAIISTYLLASSLINSLKHNSEMEEEYRRMVRELEIVPTRNALLIDMIGYAETIKASHDAATNSMSYLFTLMDNSALLNDQTAIQKT